MHKSLIISLILITLFITAANTINFNIFPNAMAIFEDDGYYDEESDSYNHYDNDEQYSYYSDKDKKYECRTGPFEGFFVSSVEFCNVEISKSPNPSVSPPSNSTGPLGPTVTCNGTTPTTNYNTYAETGFNLKIQYPQDFTFGIIDPVQNDADPRLIFACTIPPDPRYTGDGYHALRVYVHIYRANGITFDGIEQFINNTWIPRLFADLPDKRFSILAYEEKPWVTPQGNNGEIVKWNVRSLFNSDIVYKIANYFTIVEGNFYIITYLVNQDELRVIGQLAPDNFDLYNTSKVKRMIDTLCFPINSGATKPCIDDSPPNPNPNPNPNPRTVTEEWIYTQYTQHRLSSIYKVVISCSDPISTSCVNTPSKIKDVHLFAGTTCITDPGRCDLGTQNRLDIIPRSPFIEVIPTIRPLWTAFADSPTPPTPRWKIDAFPVQSIEKNFKINLEWNYAVGDKAGGIFDLSLNKTTTCDQNSVCQETKGPAYTTPGNIYGPYTVVGPEVHTGVIVQQGNLVRTFGTGLVDFGGAVLGIGAPILGPDGDSEQTPSNYPRPDLRKNSLIVKIGDGWYQGGTDTSFTSTTSGEVILLTNDAQTSDNSRGWSVKLLVK